MNGKTKIIPNRLVKDRIETSLYLPRVTSVNPLPGITAAEMYLLALFLQFPQELKESQRKSLLKKRLLIRRKLSPDEAVKLLEKKEVDSLSESYLCEWCKKETICLQKHHYPIPRKQKGKDTVNICGTCHAGFHYLTEHGTLFVTDRLKNYFSVITQDIK